MTSTNDKPGACTNKLTGPDTPAKEYPADLRRVLHLVADSAIEAHDAITRNDPESLSQAIAALMLNAGVAQSLARAWRAA